VFRLDARGASALFTSDATAALERTVALSDSLRSDILKISHHGSKFSSTREFLAAVAPLVSVVSVGANSYGHPAPEAIDRIAATGSRVFRTDEHGTVKVSWSDGLLDVFTIKAPSVDEAP
jgi:competence protein ComEC